MPTGLRSLCPAVERGAEKRDGRAGWADDGQQHLLTNEVKRSRDRLTDSDTRYGTYLRFNATLVVAPLVIIIVVLILCSVAVVVLVVVVFVAVLDLVLILVFVAIVSAVVV